MSMTMWPSSAPAPIQPRCSRPPSTSPPPIPVPSVSITTSPEPPPAPWRASASTAQLPSLSTVTGQAEPLGHHVAERRRSRAGDGSSRPPSPVRRSSVTGMPKPTAATSSSTAAARLLHRLDDRLHAAASGRARTPAAGPGGARRDRGPTTPARSLVPPRSTPMTQLGLARTAGMGAATIPTPDGRRETRIQGLPEPPAARCPRRDAGGRRPGRAARARTRRRRRSGPDYEVHKTGRRGPRLPRLPRRSRACPARRAAGSAPGASSSGSRSRCSRGSRSPPSCSWSPRRSSAATSANEVGDAARPRPVPADRREHDPRARLRRAHRGARRARLAAARAAPTRSCCCGSAAARTPRSRSRATPSSTSPGTARTRSTPRTRSAAPRSPRRPSRSSSGSRSTTSSRSASRTSRS